MQRLMHNIARLTLYFDQTCILDMSFGHVFMECSLDTSFRHVFWTSYHESLTRLRLIKDEKAIESMPLLYIKDIVYEMKRWL